MADKPPLTEFDIVTIPSSFQMMKAMLPFLDINLQKNLSLIIRFMELKQTIDFFNYASNITSMSNSTKTISTDNENSNFLLNLLNNDDFMNSIAPYLPENYKSMISGFKMFSSMSELLNQSNMDVSDLLGKYMGSAASAFGNTNTAGTNENNQENTNNQDNNAQDIEHNNENHSNNNDSGQTKQRPSSEADKGFSIFSNAMNQEQQKLFDDYLKQLDDLNL
ncbi:MAG: hypothetical protein HFJ03_11455 [Lachnospira sp.]|jgi:hypothetical protein|nr:hypothetical protein [Lachnospira sp.]